MPISATNTADPVMDGMLLIDKPSQMTSFGVVARVRRRLSEVANKKIKVGHTGTLDPFATGLMVLLVGPACKRAGELSKLDKVYEAAITLGKTSTTGDPEGEITEVTDAPVPTKQEVEAALQAFTGEIMQVPPMFSAIKINGQRAYKLARQGETVEIPARKVTIYQLELIDYAYPMLKIRAHVSSGTYIRTLAQDIGERLHTGAYCHQLRRTAVGKWHLSEAVEIEAAAQSLRALE
ncbi:MAG TPA: tRNA pseudouridine(55) synthase TruB [Verrucomicrobiae bacterium]|nr:tRNA pseudouridine(55) synthase TruB [Verrucomicrobiae bacterium]